MLGVNQGRKVIAEIQGRKTANKFTVQKNLPYVNVFSQPLKKAL